MYADFLSRNGRIGFLKRCETFQVINVSLERLREVAPSKRSYRGNSIFTKGPRHSQSYLLVMGEEGFPTGGRGRNIMRATDPEGIRNFR